MKIALVLNTSWNIYNFRMNFVKILIDKGFEVHTIAPHDTYTHYLEEIGCIHHDVKMDSRGVNPVKDTALFFELLGKYKRIKPDLILHYTIKPNIYGTLAASMKISGVHAFAISIPLPAPVSDAVRRITHRDHYMVEIRTDDGLTGTGFTLGYDASLAMVSMTDSIFRPILAGADPLCSEALWSEMYRQSIQAGRRGADVRADTAVEAAVLTREAFYALERERPALAIALLRNLLATAARTAVRLTAEVAALEA